MRIQISRAALIAGILLTFGGLFFGPTLFLGIESVYPIERMSETEMIVLGAAGIFVTFVVPMIGIALIFGSVPVPILLGL